LIYQDQKVASVRLCDLAQEALVRQGGKKGGYP